MAMKQKMKEDLLCKLFSVYNNTLSGEELCLAVIAICMLINTPTVDDLTRSGGTRKED